MQYYSDHNDTKVNVSAAIVLKNFQGALVLQVFSHRSMPQQRENVLHLSHPDLKNFPYAAKNGAWDVVPKPVPVEPPKADETPAKAKPAAGPVARSDK